MHPTPACRQAAKHGTAPLSRFAALDGPLESRWAATYDYGIPSGGKGACPMASPDVPSGLPVPPAPSASDRLDSWKEIAAYFKRDVRTVQRWEQNEGMPVHRHVHGRQGTVYAFRSEIDVWWNNGRAHLEEAPFVPPATAPRQWVPWAAAAAGLGMAVIAAVSFWPNGPAPLDFHERDWVLIADFENRTGETILDGTLEYALTRELSNSRFVNVVPQERIADVLRLMHLPADARIDQASGCEIALRDGEIRSLLIGRVEKLDSTYVLGTSIISPTTGATVASVTREAVGEPALVAAIRQLSNDVRETLGEALVSIDQSAAPLVKVTTPSLRALQLYSQADAVIAGRSRPNGDAVAEELLKQAVAADPAFASGYVHLAWALRNQGRPQEEYLSAAQTAVELADTTTDRERYFILGSYYGMVGQDENAVTAYETLLRLYPDHYWGTNNLAFTYWQLGRLVESARLNVRLADLRPHDLRVNVDAAESLIAAPDMEPAEPYLSRAEALASAEGADPWLVARTNFLPVRASWRRGALEQALTTLTRVVAAGPPPTADARDFWLRRASRAYLGLGMLQAARDTAVQIASTEERYMALDLVAWARGDQQAVRDHVQGVEFPVAYSLMLLARANAVGEARNALADWARNVRAGRHPYAPLGWEPELAAIERVVLGELARLEGREGEAIRLLEEGLLFESPGQALTPTRARGRWAPEWYLGWESLALAYLAQGEAARAAQVLDEASHVYPPPRGLGSTSVVWMNLETRRAQVYRQLGRQEEAARIEAELLELLAHADADHPILREIKAAQAARLSTLTLPIPTPH